MNGPEWLKIISAGASAVTLLDAMVLERYFFEVKKHAIGDVKNGKDKIKILLLTDIHLKRWITANHRKLAKSINQIDPDLILIAGDVLDETARNIEPLRRFLKLLVVKCPKAVIMGNHDHKSGASLDDYHRVYKEFDLDFLLNASIAYKISGHRIVVTGLDDFIESKSDVRKAVEGVGREQHHLLLLHSPLQQEDVLKELEQINIERGKEQQLNISYIFAGHNHGGQVRLPGIVPYLPIKSGKYVNGWYNKEKPHLYVSKGYGTTLLPFRFFARAEITLFEYYV